MVYLNVLGQSFLILGSFQRTTELLDRRSANYSDRFRMPMTMELYVSHSFRLDKLINKSVRGSMGAEFVFPLLPYGVSWRKHRKTFHEYFQMNRVSQYLPTQEREVHVFLRRLLVTPDNFLHHIRQ